MVKANHGPSQGIMETETESKSGQAPELDQPPCSVCVWKPIEFAPKDGSSFVVWLSGRPGVMQYYPKCGAWGPSRHFPGVQPTHFLDTECESLLEELESAIALLCSAREKLKQEDDSSDYHRISLQILPRLQARRSHSSNEKEQ